MGALGNFLRSGGSLFDVGKKKGGAGSSGGGESISSGGGSASDTTYTAKVASITNIANGTVKVMFEPLIISTDTRRQAAAL